MDTDDEEVVLQVENSAAIERSAKMSALRREWGGKGKGGILGDLFNRHQGKGKGGYAYCKGSCKCRAGALKDGCLKKKGETILNQLDQGILPGEHTVDRPSAAQMSAPAWKGPGQRTTCDRARTIIWCVPESRASKPDSPKYARGGGNLQWANRVNRTRQKHSQSAEGSSNWL
jgi:hypothetical protein